MSQLAFQNRNSSSLGAMSPDSVIFSAESNFSSLFSSTSCSVERCSFTSDLHHHHSLPSDISQHLAVRECDESCCSSGPDRYRNKCVYKNSIVCRKVEKGEVQKGGGQLDIKDEDQVLDSGRSSFSRALKDCQVRRSRSEVLLKKVDRRRPASLDLNTTLANVTSSSPRFGVMKKSEVSIMQPSAFPSPGTPSYRHTDVGIQKGWSSERVPLQSNADRRNANVLLPFSNGRTLPSKWEDAERWIMSPVAGDCSVKPSITQQPQRRPKAKSGPLGPSRTAHDSTYSPAVHMFDGGTVENLMASVFAAGVISADSFEMQCGGMHRGNANYPSRMDACMGRSVSVHGCPEVLCQPFLPASQDEKLDNVEDEINNISRAVSRRDMATQMSPERSDISSLGGMLSFSPSNSSVLPTVEWESLHSPKQEVRDVQVDERVTVMRWPKKLRARNPVKGSDNVDDWKRKFLDVQSTNWEVSEMTKSGSEIKREEARITAWENLQKAKAEAAIRKLEMKLEKKRSSSMDKIMNKLRSAQKKAETMRSSVVVNPADQVATTSDKVISLRGRGRQIGSLSGCFFTCHAS